MDIVTISGSSIRIPSDIWNNIVQQQIIASIWDIFCILLLCAIAYVCYKKGKSLPKDIRGEISVTAFICYTFVALCVVCVIIAVLQYGFIIYEGFANPEYRAILLLLGRI